MSGNTQQDQESNQVVMSGVVQDVSPLSSTPGGIPYRYFTLEHRSRQEEAGLAREVNCRIRVDLRGQPLIDLMKSLSSGQRVEVQGFLSRAGFQEENATRLVLHAQTMTLLSV